MKKCKSIVAVVLVCAFCFALCACMDNPVAVETEKLITIPDVEKLDVDTAKTLLAGKGLIPKVEYEYNNDYDYDLVIRTEPEIGSEISEDTPVILYVCKGPSYYEINDAVGIIWDIEGIDGFKWSREAEDGIGTKSFYNIYAQEGYLFLTVCLNCKSEYPIEFYGDFGTASISDTFDKTVPIKVIYDSEKVDNNGAPTEFDLKIPLTDLGVQKPTNINVKFDFLVNNERQTFQGSFDLTW